jgi:hypothetical protein
MRAAATLSHHQKISIGVFHDVTLIHRLQRASNLAQIQNVLRGLKYEKRALTDSERTFLKSFLWPWWQWMMGHQDQSSPFRDSDLDRVFFDIVLEDGYAKDHEEALDDLCKQIWDGEEVTEEVQPYLIELILNLRKRVLHSS